MSRVALFDVRGEVNAQVNPVELEKCLTPHQTIFPEILFGG